MSETLFRLECGHASASDSGFALSVHMESSPQVAYLRGEIADGWRLRRAIAITVELDGNTVLVSDEEFSIYGQGDTKALAIDDYVAALIEYYELLRERAYEHEPTAVMFARLESALTKSDP